VSGARLAETQTFGTTTGDLLRLADWLTARRLHARRLHARRPGEHGEFGKPVFNVLEGTCEVWRLNVHHITAVPGRKTDVKDAQWIAELLAHGVVRPSCIPPRPQRALRDLTRARTTVVRARHPGPPGAQGARGRQLEAGLSGHS
jgi:transposase